MEDIDFTLNLDGTDKNDFKAELAAAQAVRQALYEKALGKKPNDEDLFREPECTPELVDRILAAAHETYTLSDVAKYSGMVPEALLYLLKANQTLANDVDKAQIPRIKEQIKRYAEAQMSREAIAQCMGIDVREFRLLFERFPFLEGWLCQSANNVLATVANKAMLLAMKGDGRMIQFVLERKGGWGKTDKLEISGPGGEPITSKTVREYTKEQAADKYQEMLKGDLVE